LSPFCQIRPSVAACLETSFLSPNINKAQKARLTEFYLVIFIKEL
jgi:hypothetical protein